VKAFARPGFDWLLDGCRGIWSPVVSGNTGATVLDINPTTDNHGALSGMTAAQAWQQSTIGNVLAFDGANDSVTIATAETLTTYPFTLANWVYHPSTIPDTTAALTLSVGVGQTQYFAIGYRQATPRPGIFARNTTFTNNANYTTTFNPGWVSLVGVFVSATRRELWVDGRLLAVSTTSVPQLASVSSVRLGSGFTQLYYPQRIAEAIVHAQRWTPEQIAQYVEAGPGGALTLQPPTRRRSRYLPSTPPPTNNRRRTSRLVCYPG